MRVLVVEDDPIQCEINRAYFEFRGYEVTSTESAETAWDKFQRRPFDIVMTDWELPGAFNGMELCRLIRDRIHCPHHPVDTWLLVLSCHTHFREAFRAGAHWAMSKPLNTDALDYQMQILEQMSGLNSVEL